MWAWIWSWSQIGKIFKIFKAACLVIHRIGTVFGFLASRGIYLSRVYFRILAHLYFKVFYKEAKMPKCSLWDTQWCNGLVKAKGFKWYTWTLSLKRIISKKSEKWVQNYIITYNLLILSTFWLSVNKRSSTTLKKYPLEIKIKSLISQTWESLTHLLNIRWQ